MFDAGRDGQYEVGVKGDLTYIRAHLGEVPDESMHEYEEGPARGLPSGRGVIFEARTRDAYPETLQEE